MINILEKDIARKITLIFELYKATSYLESERLADMLQCTTKTLIADIEHINFNSDVIQIERQKGIYFDKKKADFQLIYSKLLVESTVVLFLEAILKQRLSIYELQVKLHISESKCRKIVKKWNHFFTIRNLEMTIKIDNKKVVIEGNEQAIRVLFHYMIFDLNYQAIYLNTLETLPLYTYYETFMQRQNPERVKNRYKMFQSYTYVIASLYRTNNGYLDENIAHYHQLSDNNVKIDFQRAIHIMASYFSIECDEVIINQLLNRCYFRGDDMTSDANVKKRQKMTVFFEGILSEIGYSISDNLKREKIITDLMLAYYSQLPISFFFIDVNEIIFENQKNIYKSLFKKMNQLIIQESIAFQSLEVKGRFFREVIYIMNSEISLAKYALARPSIVLYLFCSIARIQGAHELLKLYFGERIKIVIAHELNIEVSEADVIISNYQIPKHLRGKSYFFPETLTLGWLNMVDERMKKNYIEKHGQMKCTLYAGKIKKI